MKTTTNYPVYTGSALQKMHLMISARPQLPQGKRITKPLRNCNGVVYGHIFSDGGYVSGDFQKTIWNDVMGGQINHYYHSVRVQRGCYIFKTVVGIARHDNPNDGVNLYPIDSGIDGKKVTIKMVDKNDGYGFMPFNSRKWALFNWEVFN